MHDPTQNPGVLSLKQIDDIDTRRETFYLLSKLTPVQRIAFLYWCCDQANNRMIHTDVNKVWVEHSTGDAREVRNDLWMLHVQFNLPLPRILSGLERAVRNPERIGPLLLE